MIGNIISELVKLLNGKNVSYVVLLIITCMSAYLVYDFTVILLKDNREFINGINSMDHKLSEIIVLLKEHDERHPGSD